MQTENNRACGDRKQEQEKHLVAVWDESKYEKKWNISKNVRFTSTPCKWDTIWIQMLSLDQAICFPKLADSTVSGIRDCSPA